MPPFMIIILLNTAAYGLAYLWLYPRWCGRDLPRIAALDACIIAGLLVVGYVLFHGEGHRFSLLLFDTNWVVFLLVTGLAIEFPLLLRYLSDHGLGLSDLLDPDDPEDRP